LTYFADSKQLKELVRRVGGLLDGVAANNTIAGPIVNHKGEHAFPGRPTAGISGAPIKWAGLKMTKLLKQFREEFGHSYKIIGIGGVLDASHFHEYREAGTDIVMSVTGAMWNPNLAVEIKRSLGLTTTT
jgi:dihydroorotate dehydrogenase (NAD+) catalytic subunit